MGLRFTPKARICVTYRENLPLVYLCDMLCPYDKFDKVENRSFDNRAALLG